MNSYLPSLSHRQQLKVSASTPHSLQLPGTTPLAATTYPSSAAVTPATGSHPEFKNAATAAPSAFEGGATGGRSECEDETDGAGKNLDHNKFFNPYLTYSCDV